MTCLALYEKLAFEYQNSGFLGTLMEGCLDAPSVIPSGSTVADYAVLAPGTGVVRCHLTKPGTTDREQDTA